MSKANFYSNNIINSKSLTVKIPNSTNIPKGALIRVLPSSKYQTSENRYFTDSHLKKVYRFYKQNGYEKYSSLSSFFSDLEKQNPDCIVKTYLTVYKGLKECSIYPFLKNTDRYVYKSIEEQNFIEEIIEETYYHVFYTLKDKLDVNKVRNLEQLRTYIKMVIKHKAHLDRAIKSFNRTKPVGFLDIKYTPGLGDNSMDNSIEMLILYFLNPTNCDSLSLTYIQAIDKYLNQIQHEIASYEYKLLLNNIPTIIIFIERVKSEISKC